LFCANNHDAEAIIFIQHWTASHVKQPADDELFEANDQSHTSTSIHTKLKAIAPGMTRATPFLQCSDVARPGHLCGRTTHAALLSDFSRKNSTRATESTVVLTAILRLRHHIPLPFSACTQP